METQGQRLVLIAVPILVLATPVFALDPPARYDFVPNPHPIVVTTTTERLCPDRNRYGCFVIKGGLCVVYISERLLPRERAAVERHEFAHCAGWPASHPL